MKNLENDIDILKLKAIAEDKAVSVPDGFRDEMNASLNALAFISEEPTCKSRTLRYAVSIAASLAVLVSVGIGLNSGRNSRLPEDTFSDPYLAYAQLEETFAMISSKMDKGLSIAQEAGNALVKTNEIMEKAIN